MTAPRRVRPDELNAVMAFDHVIRVHPGGDATGALVSDPPNDRAYWAPEVMDTEIVSGGVDADRPEDPGWTLLTGYTGQDRYTGPGMHDSEYIGGRLAADILSTPGLYVAIADTFSDDGEPEGWIVAHKPLPEDPAPRTTGTCQWCGHPISGIPGDGPWRATDGSETCRAGGVHILDLTRKAGRS